MRHELDKQLDAISKSLMEMGELGERAVRGCIEALTADNVRLAHEIMHMDDEIDRKEREIEDRCMRMLLRQQPVATDLRIVSSALKMVTDIERIGDQAADISEIVTMFRGELLPDMQEIFVSMSDIVIKMLNAALAAFAARDLDAARVVIRMDDEVDSLFCRAKDALIELIASKSGGEAALDMLMIAKYFERIGDHAVNIAEWAEYAITGRHKGQRIG